MAAYQGLAFSSACNTQATITQSHPFAVGRETGRKPDCHTTREGLVWVVCGFQQTDVQAAPKMGEMALLGRYFRPGVAKHCDGFGQHSILGPEGRPLARDC